MRDLVEYANNAKLWMNEHEARTYNEGLQYGIDALRAVLSWECDKDAMKRIDGAIEMILAHATVKLDVSDE